MAKLPENKKRRLQGLNQDVLAVQVPVEPVASEPVPLRKAARGQQPVSEPRSKSANTVWLALGLAVAALLLAIWQWVGQQQLSNELAQLKADYATLSASVADSADKPTRVALNAVASGSVDSSAVANLRDDLRELSARVRNLSVAVAKAGQDDGETATLTKRIAEVESGLNAVSGRVSALASRPASPAAPAPAPVSAQAAPDPRVDELQTKVNKIDKDLQALYRILQG